MGKGSGRRPTFISEETYQQNYDRAFGVKPPKARYIPPPLKGEEPKEPTDER